MTIYKEDLEECQRRVEAWWQHEMLDRAVVQVRAPRAKPASAPDEASSMSPAEVERWFLDPNLVIPRLKQQLAEIYFGGEAFPVLQPVLGRMVAITAAYLGCPLEFINTETVWAHPIITDWDARPAFDYTPNNALWQKSQRLMRAAVEQANGYFVGVPDLNGPTEILARLRGTQTLALDFYDHPDHLKPALAEINRAWFRYWQECVAITHATGGYFFWMGLWSDVPATDLQSDFSYLISSSMFDEYFLPFIAEQTELVPRTIYHLDGKGAIRHLESLLALPHLNGIQWVPGAGTKPAVEWIPLLQRVQAAGKLVYVYCAPDHVEKLLKELNPEGLMMVVLGCESVDEAQVLLENVETWSKKKSGGKPWHSLPVNPSGKT